MQNNNIKISVIMPIYNVAAYLDRAISSVLNQTFTDFELILVNDGSRDSSKEICEKYVELDSRVKLINQENSGAHIARNNGMKEASGKYFAFFDSDDYVENSMLSDLYEIAEKYESDLVVSGFNINTYYDDENFVVRPYIPWTRADKEIDNYTNSIDFRKHAFNNFDNNMFYPPWNKLYKASYIKDNGIEFPQTYRDDFPFVLYVIKDIEKVTFTKKAYYNFIRKRSDSETQKYYKNLYSKREEEHENMLNLYKFWGLLDDKNSKEMISRRYIDRLIECMVNLYNAECTLNESEKKEEIKSYLNNKNFNDSIIYARPHKFYLKLMYMPLRSKNVFLCALMSKFINFVKSKNIKLFSLLKMNR